MWDRVRQGRAALDTARDDDSARTCTCTPTPTPTRLFIMTTGTVASACTVCTTCLALV